MANPYLEIFKAPDAIGFSLTGFIARMPIAMISIGIMAMMTQIDYSYGDAGYVSGSYVLASALISPQLSRLADHHGQRIVVIGGTLISAIALGSLLIAALNHMPLQILLALGVMVGFMPSFGAFVRARWSKYYSGTPRLRSAFAFESIVDEMIFMIGPVIALYFTTNFFPEAGLIAALTFLVVGSVIFLTQRRSEPVPMKRSKDSGKPVILMPQIFYLSLKLLALGGVFGTAEITALAFAKDIGLETWASLPLVAYAFGSFIAGVFYGYTNIRAPLVKQLLVIITIAAATTLPLLIVYDLWTLSIVLFVAGAACSPTIIISMALIEMIVPANKLTEGMSWSVTGMSVGVSIGAAISGRLIDSFGAGSGFYVSIIAGFSALIIVALTRKLLASKSTMRVYS